MASGRRLRVAAQLSDTKKNSELWNETFEGELKNLFALLDQVTARVGNSIDKPMVIAAASESDRQVIDGSVADLLLRARALEVQTQSLQRLSEIESIYRQILHRDRANLAALTGLATILAIHASWLAPYESTDPALTEKLIEARDLALAVKAVDPTNSRVYIPIALHAQHVNDFDAARNAWEAALRLNPRGPGAHNNLAVFYLYMGEPARAIPLLERSFELRPRANATVFAALGAANLALGENDRAIGWLLRALDLNLENLDVYSFLAMPTRTSAMPRSPRRLPRSIESGLRSRAPRARGSPSRGPAALPPTSLTSTRSYCQIGKEQACLERSANTKADGR